MASTPKPSLSIRKYIQWGTTFPTENTSTKVLTSPAPHRSFVDVRLLLVPLSREPPPLRDLARHVDWAFAGSALHRDGDDRQGRPPHDVFRHWVDSRHPDAAAVVDEGDFFPGPGPAESLERGVMVNPASGRPEPYEECWIDGLAGAAASHAGWVLRWEDGEADAAAGKGMMVRVGAVVQGVLRAGDEVGVGRWELGGEGEGAGERKAVAEVGRVQRFYMGDWDGLTTGQEVRAEDGQKWVCVESW
ncbi:hypothetical protein JX265_000477 [Neoarthrinium moseri]|uniref:Protein HRI1 n=1 Tax=Neoarthrinium moseri TaxID=1658444 RepID=A0A9P9WYL5_9PEZI|nr:hypothetical protein JX265_000477 [Neoarthrinium moseri]